MAEKGGGGSTAGAGSIKTPEEGATSGSSLSLAAHTAGLSIDTQLSQIDLIVLKEERKVDAWRR